MASKKKHQNIHTNSSAKLAEYEAKQSQAKATVERKRTDNKRAILVSVAALVVAALLQVAYFGFGPGTPVAKRRIMTLFMLAAPVQLHPRRHRPMLRAGICSSRVRLKVQ